MKNEKKKVIANTGWIIAQHITTLVISFIITPISARYLAPKNFGLLNYSYSIVGFLLCIADFGLNSILVNEMTEREDYSLCLGTAFRLRHLGGMIAAIISIIIAFALGDSQLFIILTAIQSVTIILSSYDILEKWFQISLSMKYVSIAIVISQIVVAIWQVFLLVSQKSVVYFAFSKIINTSLIALVVFVFFKYKNKEPLRYSKDMARMLLSKSWHYMIVSLAITIYMQIDVIMIGKMISSYEVGIYTVAVALTSLWQFIPISIINSARPIILQSKKEGRERYTERLQQTFLIISGIGVILGIGYTLFGRLAIHILYGDEYMRAYTPLLLLIWSSVVAMIGTARSIWLVAEGYVEYNKFFAISAAVLNVLLNLVFIKLYGIIGAALATLISYFYEVFIATLFFDQTREFNRLYLGAFINSKKLLSDIIR